MGSSTGRTVKSCLTFCRFPPISSSCSLDLRRNQKFRALDPGEWRTRAYVPFSSPLALLNMRVRCHWSEQNIPNFNRKFLSPAMASAIFFLDLKGKTLLARNYRGDIPMSAVEKFMPLLMDAEEENTAAPPCISHEGVNVSSSQLSRTSVTRSISTYSTVICTS